MKTHVFNRSLWRLLLAPALVLSGLTTTAAANTTDSLIVTPQCHTWVISACEATQCPKREFSKNISREFNTLANGMTALYNKHGQVNVHVWAQNKVKIDIQIVVNANDQRDADRTFGKINVNFTNTPGYVKAETVVADMSNVSGGWGGMFTSLTTTNTCQDFKINYEVWMPATNQLDLRNKYGNSFVGSLNGKLLADIKYGDLRTETIGADADLNIEYGKATLAGTQNLVGQVGYGGISVDNARDVQLDSRYSECTFRRAGNVRLTSKYDDFDLGVIDELRLQTKYSDFEVKSVRTLLATAQYTDLQISNATGQVDADLTNGELVIGLLSKGFGSVNVVGSYTSVRIGLERGATTRFDVQGDYTNVDLGSSATVRKRNDSGRRTSEEGFFGDANSRSLIKLQLKYGGVTLK
jgi:hypothetical protein